MSWKYATKIIIIERLFYCDCKGFDDCYLHALYIYTMSWIIQIHDKKFKIKNIHFIMITTLAYEDEYALMFIPTHQTIERTP